MFKSLGSFTTLLRQANSMGGKMKEINEQLKNQRAEGAAGGGMVSVEVNGLGDVLQVKIDPTLIASGDREMIEDLCTAATNQAIGKSRQLHAEAMQSITKDINIPQLTDAISEVAEEIDKES